MGENATDRYRMLQQIYGKGTVSITQGSCTG